MSDFYGFELSYAEICMFLDASSASSLVSGTGYVACTAARPSVDVDGYELTSWASGTATTTSPVSVWGENRELLQLLSITGTSFSVNSDGGMDIHPGDIVRIGSEILCVKSVTGAPNSTYSISVKRGCADTLPERHSKGDAVWFYQSGAEVDPVVRDTGQRVYMTAAPMADGAETGGAAASTQIWLTGRGAAPYPPAGVKINSQYWPTRVSGTINVTWVGRDRTALEDNLVDFYDRTVDTTETGVTYQYQLVRVISSREQVGITFGIASGNSLSLGPYNAGSSRWSLVLDLWAVKDGAISEHFTHEFVYFSGA